MMSLKSAMHRCIPFVGHVFESLGLMYQDTRVKRYGYCVPNLLINFEELCQTVADQLFNNTPCSKKTKPLNFWQ